MEKEIRVFVVDDNQNVVKTVEEYFSSHVRINVVGKASDGEEAL